MTNKRNIPLPPSKGELCLSFFACLMQSLESYNDKQKKHPPAPFKGGTLFVLFACLMQSLKATKDKQSSPFQGNVTKKIN